MPEYGQWSSSQWNKEGLCLSLVVEEKEDVSKLDLFFNLRNLQLIQNTWTKNGSKVWCHLPQKLRKTRLLNKIKMYFQDI